MVGKLVKVWPVILSLIAVSVGYGMIRQNVFFQEKKNDAQDVILRSNSDRITRLETTIELLPEMRQDIKTMLRYQRRRRDEEN